MSVGRPKPPVDSQAGREIDALYGLEPVYEPGGDAQPEHREGTQFERVDCPYCGESFETLVDLSAGSSHYVEDCQICCQPIEMRLETDDEGALVQLHARRGD